MRCPSAVRQECDQPAWEWPKCKGALVKITVPTRWFPGVVETTTARRPDARPRGSDTDRAVKALAPVFAELGGGQVAVHGQIAKLSVVGVGMKTHSGVAASVFEALAAAKINIELISTSEIKISVVIALDRADEAARVTHKAFGLDA